MNSQQSLKNSIVRLGTCSNCGKSFLSGYSEDCKTVFDTIKNFWKPNLCDYCRNSNETKTKNSTTKTSN